MHMITRFIRPTLLQAKRSFLVLGPRQTGKSTLIRSLEPDLEINLMHQPPYLAFASNPHELEQRLPQGKARIFIDEIQRLPSLLNTIQTLLDSGRPHQYLLTGSSARKLRRGQANLLPGRIFTFYLGPVVSAEMRYQVDTQKALAFGTLPGLLSQTSANTARKLLRSYAATYLVEEIQAESLTRNLEGFSRFLKVIAEWSGRFLDLSKMAQAAQVERTSVVRWTEILEDTLIASRVNVFSSKLSTRLVKHPRIYFFDVGVLNGLLGNFVPSSDRAGNLFEHLIFSQLKHSAAARDEEISITTFRTESGSEVDFVIEWQGKLWAVEVKHSNRVDRHDLTGLKNFHNYAKPYKSQVWYAGGETKVIDGIAILPWQKALKEMGL